MLGALPLLIPDMGKSLFRANLSNLNERESVSSSERFSEEEDSFSEREYISNYKI